MRHWPSELEYEHEHSQKKSIYDKVIDRVGMISSNQHVHIHQSHNHQVGERGSWSSSAVIDTEEAFKALCDILEEELFPKIEEPPKLWGVQKDEFLDEDEMNIK